MKFLQIIVFHIRSIDTEIKCDLLETGSEFESWLYQFLAMCLWLIIFSKPQFPIC